MGGGGGIDTSSSSPLVTESDQYILHLNHDPQPLPPPSSPPQRASASKFSKCVIATHSSMLGLVFIGTRC